MYSADVIRPLMVVLALVVVSTQLLVVYNLRHRVLTKQLKAAEAEDKAEQGQENSEDEDDLGEKLDNMKEKFPQHPNMVISKLNKQIQTEEKRTNALKGEIYKLKQVLGFDPGTVQANHHIGGPTAAEAVHRKLQSVTTAWCPEIPPNLLGQVRVKQDGLELAAGSQAFNDWYSRDLRPGGAWSPTDCKARQKVAILVPYRDRPEQLKIFLHHMHPILQRQQLDYRIVVAEQGPDGDFNRAALLNVGYAEAKAATAASRGYDCLVFHDVDLLPEDDRNLYLCPEGDKAKHVSVAVDKWDYRLQYPTYFGGVTAVSTRLFEAINGFSNKFYGWGGEDDDLYNRIRRHGNASSIHRMSADVAKFTMLRHDKVDQNEDLDEMMAKSKRNELGEDGLTTLDYQLLTEPQELPLYTRLLVKLPEPPLEGAKKKRKPKSWLDKAMTKLTQGVTNKVAKGIVDTLIGSGHDRGGAVYI